ncbi:hypothetical protein N7470_003857 [Penicillium chermesinum]|nr:hypothetical protein N7470_003857 [Penicillium chermesinum]
MPGPGFSLHQKIYINSKDVDKFFKYFKPTHDAIIKEPECRFLEVYQDPKEPGTISWVENWYLAPIAPPTSTGTC